MNYLFHVYLFMNRFTSIFFVARWKHYKNGNCSADSLQSAYITGYNIVPALTEVQIYIIYMIDKRAVLISIVPGQDIAFDLTYENRRNIS